MVARKMQKKTLSNKTEAATNQDSENSTVLEMEAENKYGGKEAIKQHEDKKENVSREIKVFFRRAVGARFPSALNTLVDSIYCCYKPTTDMWDGTSCKGLLRCNEITSQVLVTYHPQPTEDNFQSFSVEYQRKRSRFSFCLEQTGYRSGSTQTRRSKQNDTHGKSLLGLRLKKCYSTPFLFIRLHRAGI